MKLLPLFFAFCFGEEELSDHVKTHALSGQGSFRAPSAMLIDMVIKDRREEAEKLLLGSPRFMPIDINVHDYLGRYV